MLSEATLVYGAVHSPPRTLPPSVATVARFRREQLVAHPRAVVVGPALPPVPVVGLRGRLRRDGDGRGSNARTGVVKNAAATNVAFKAHVMPSWRCGTRGLVPGRRVRSAGTLPRTRRRLGVAPVRPREPPSGRGRGQDVEGGRTAGLGDTSRGRPGIFDKLS